VALIELGPRCAMIPGGVNVGVIRAPAGVVLVDTGLNETNAKRMLKTVREEIGGEVVAILTTHAHADHFGGNATVTKRTGAKVYAPRIDEAILRDPILSPTLLYGGADPFDGVRTNFLLADPSPVDGLLEAGSFHVAGLEVDVVSLAGHSPNQVGIVVDHVFFCADVVLPESILAKYRIPYLFSLSDHLRSLDLARSIACEVAVAGHGPLLASHAELVALIDLNRALIDDLMVRVVEFASGGRGAEEILTMVLRHYEAPVADASAYYLLQPTVLAFLSHLERVGLVRHEIRDRRSLWIS
jgi:glyoxylase-like metal-dependent hydrolase (beta-lactamase superfamily II)